MRRKRFFWRPRQTAGFDSKAAIKRGVGFGETVLAIVRERYTDFS
jgi:hypothetical protein